MMKMTLCFLVKKDDAGKIIEVCLGKRKSGVGQNLWVGIGGKIEDGETIENATIRETEEEIGVKPRDIQKIAETDFQFPYKPNWNQYVYVYMADNWVGEIKESEEIIPEWFKIDEIPYNRMWDDAKYWLPQVIRGQKIKGMFIYGEDNHKIKEKQIDILE